MRAAFASLMVLVAPPSLGPVARLRYRTRVILRRARDRRRAAGLLAALGVHLGVAALLASVAPRLVLTQGRPEALQVELVTSPAGEPTPPLRTATDTATTPPRPATTRRSVRPASPPPLPAAPAPTPARRPRSLASPPAVPPPGGAASGAGVASARPAGRGAATGASEGGDAEGAARALVRNTVGCDHETWLRLSPAERERCDAPLLEGMRSGLRIDPVPGDKRLGFDRQAAADARRRAFQEGPVYSPTTACTGAGSNYGTGCLPDDAIKHLRPK